MATRSRYQLLVVAEIAIHGAPCYDWRCFEGLGILKRRSVPNLGIRRTAADFCGTQPHAQDFTIRGASLICVVVLDAYLSSIYSNQKCKTIQLEPR
jgi:hypothetical protein